LAVTAKALKELQKEASEALKKAESEAAKVKDIKAKTQHERTAGVFSAAANVGKKADKVESIESALAQVREQQKDEQRKREARELDPSIQTEVETDAESSRPAPKSIVQKWKDLLENSEPYRDAESLIKNIQIDVTERMMTPREFKNLLSESEKNFDEFLTGEVSKLQKGKSEASVSLAHQYWKNLEDFGWKNYQHRYERASKVHQRTHELQQRYVEQRKEMREARKLEKQSRLLQKAEKAKEEQFKASKNKSSKSQKVVSESESQSRSESEAGSGTDIDQEPDFNKEAEEEVHEEDVQEKLHMNPAIPTITSKRLEQMLDAPTLATYSQTLMSSDKLNPANGILLLQRMDEILKAENEKLAKMKLTRMPGFSIQVTGKIVKMGKQSTYKSMHESIQRTISGLQEKIKAVGKASSSSSKSTGRRK